MNNRDRYLLVSAPRPSDAEDVGVLLLDGLWRLAWLRQGGRIREPFGGEYVNAREACRAAVYIRSEWGLT